MSSPWYSVLLGASVFKKTEASAYVFDNRMRGIHNCETPGKERQELT